MAINVKREITILDILARRPCGYIAEMAKTDTEPTELPPLYIRERMAKPRVTGEALAERMGTTPATVSRLLNGRRKMTLEWLFAFSKALGTPIEDFFTPPSAAPQTAEERLRPALLAYGVDRDELDQVIRVIGTYVSDDEKSEQTSSEDQSEPSNRPHESGPSGKRPRQPAS